MTLSQFIPVKDSRDFFCVDLQAEDLELESLARSAGFTEDEIAELLGKSVNELPLSSFKNQEPTEDVPF